MEDSRKKAEKFVKEADKALHKLFGFKEDKLNTASDLLTRAGNLYKIDRDFKSAGDCYFKAAKYLQEAGNKSGAINKSRDATLCYFKSLETRDQARESMDFANSLVTDGNDPYKAAEHLVSGAKNFNKEGAKDLALETYEKALSLLNQTTGADSLTATVLEEMAYLTGDWDLVKASNYFVQAGELRMKTQLTMGLGNRLFINAVFCRLAVFDSVGADELWKKVTSEISPSMKFSMDGKLVDELIKASIFQPEQMADIIARYSKMHTIDGWTKDLFHKMAPETDDTNEHNDEEALL